jgi:hypothetical protein
MSQRPMLREVPATAKGQRWVLKLRDLFAHAPNAESQ